MPAPLHAPLPGRKRALLLAAAVAFSLGIMLWTILSLATGNLLIGFIFGWFPGVVVGGGLMLTAHHRRDHPGKP